jgi:hypothetical protein
VDLDEESGGIVSRKETNRFRSDSPEQIEKFERVRRW